MELSIGSYLNAGIAVTAAAAVALSPLVVSPAGPHVLDLPHVSVAQIDLAAVINPADIAALVANLNAAMSSVSSTVTSVVATSGQTLAGALNAAAGLNNTVWDGLIGAAGASPMLAAVLVALKATTAGGLSQLSTLVGGAGSAVALSTGEVANLLTSTVTGSLGVALHVVAGIVNDPLSAASYIGLLTAPVGVIGLALQGGINAAAGLASAGVGLASTVVRGVTAQIGNALSLVTGLLQAGEGLTDVALINGALTALQGIVSAPITAALAGVNGLTSAAANAGQFTLGRVASGASAAVGTWLGSGPTPGAMQAAIAGIGSAPLSPASYTNAIAILAGAGVTTVQTVIGTASSFASLPFRVAADVTNTTADVINSFTNGMATAASGLLQAAGLPSFIAGLPYAVALAVTGAVNVAAFATSAALNSVSSVIDIGQAIGGVLSPLSAASLSARVGPAALDAAAVPTTLVELHSAAVTVAAAASSESGTAADAAAGQSPPIAVSESKPAVVVAPIDTTPPLVDGIVATDPSTTVTPAVTGAAAEPDAGAITKADPKPTATTGAETAGSVTDKTAGTGTPKGAQGSADSTDGATSGPAATGSPGGAASTSAGGRHCTEGPAKQPGGTTLSDSAGQASPGAASSSTSGGFRGGGRHARPDTGGSDIAGPATSKTPGAVASSGGRHARPDTNDSDGAGSASSPAHAATTGGTSAKAA